MHSLLSSPWLYLAGFAGASALMIGCLNHLERKGLEGTVIGTLIMPFCSGAPNLIFALVMARRDGPGEEVLVNALVNNMTNLSLLIGLPGLIWALTIIPRKKLPKKKLRARRLSRLSLALTLTAVLFFTGVTWALARDGSLSFGDGFALVALFLFWQSFELFDVMRTNIEKGRSWGAWTLLDLSGLAVGAAVMFVTVDWLVEWISGIRSGFISYRYIGWLSGWLMVLPNAVPAFYYAAVKRADIVYSSQVGDGHMCIPLCIGLFALWHPIRLPGFFNLAVGLLTGMTVLHLLLVVLLGRLPRVCAAALVAAYAVFLYAGLICP